LGCCVVAMSNPSHKEASAVGGGWEAMFFACCAVMRSPTAVRPSLPGWRRLRSQQRGWSARSTPTDGESIRRPILDRDEVTRAARNDG
jgi:hypothetical protein